MPIASAQDPLADAIAALTANPMVQTVLSILTASWVALYLIAAVFTYRDLLERSGQRRVAAIGAGFVMIATPLFYPFALLMVRALRPADASRDRAATAIEMRVMAAEAAAIIDCPTCGRPLPAEWMACPDDAALVRARCATCKGLIALSARACPLCGAGSLEVG